jgi:hypothetical protein
MVAITLTFLGGILLFFKKGWRQTRFPGVVRKKGIVITMSAVILYVLLFKTLWPLQDPAMDILFGIRNNQGVVFQFQGNPFDIMNASEAEFLLYGKRAVMPLVNKLDDNDANVRESSVYLLGYLWDERAVEPLIKALKDKNVHVQERVINLLSDIKDPRVVEPLIRCALDGRNADVRIDAKYALIEIKGPLVAELLIRALKDKKECVRRRAKWLLEDSPWFIDPLLKKLDTENKHFRQIVLDILGNFPGAIVMDKLIEKLSNEKVDYIIWDIVFNLEIRTRVHYQGDWPEAADWWQQWWGKNREDFLKSRRQE